MISKIRIQAGKNMAVTISAADFNKEEQVQKTSINYKENKSNNKAAGVENAFAAVAVSCADKTAGVKGNTYEELLKEADDVKQQIMDSASTAKLSLKALAKKLSGAEAVRIDEDGFNIMDASKEEMVNIIDKIRIELAMHSDSYVAYGQPVSKEAIESVAGSAGMANVIEAKLQEHNLPSDEDTVAEVENTLKKVETLEPLSESTKNYMVRNQVEPTIDGIYQAEHVAASQQTHPQPSAKKLTDEEFERMKPQVAAVIERAGLEVNEQNLNNARSFIDNDIPVTEENLIYKHALDDLELGNMDENDLGKVLDRIIDNLAVGGEAKNTRLTDEQTIFETVRDAIDTLHKAQYQDVVNVFRSGEKFTITSLKLSMSAVVTTGEAGYPVSFGIDMSYAFASGAVGKDDTYNAYTYNGTDGKGDYSQIDKAYYTLVETRILMTAQAGVFLEKNNISVMNTPISELEQQLKAFELNSPLYQEAGELYESVFEVRRAVDEISRSPIEVFGQLFGQGSGGIISLEAFASAGGQLKRQFDRANSTYEAVGTEVRKDLGDSVGKAVDNSTDSIVRELGLQGTKADKDAIRILAVNSMEMTRENVQKIKEVYAVVNNLIENMKPETVLKMINDGINPMQDDIRDVNDYLVSMNEGATRANEEKFSKFLFKLDRTEGISEEKRRQFIGIYQMMNIFTKDAGAAAGALVKQGADLTMANLISAYNSRKHAGIDKTVDDETGMAEVYGSTNYFVSLFSASKKYITPNTLKNADNKKDITAQQVESFVEELEQNYDEAVEQSYAEDYIKEQMHAALNSAHIIRELKRAGMPESLGNIQAVKAMLEAGRFPSIRGYGRSIQSLSEEMIEKIGHKEELEAMYDEFATVGRDELEEAITNSLTDHEGKPIDMDYEGLHDIRMDNRAIGYIKNLAVRHDYRIPFVKDDQIGMIKFTLVQDDEKQGRISIHMDSVGLGEVSVEAKIDGKQAGIVVLSDTTGMVDDHTFDAKLGELKDMFAKEFDMDDVSVKRARADEVPYITYDGAAEHMATDKLYEMAGAIVKFLA